MNNKAILYNFKISESEINDDLSINRGFLYGDAFFETMIFKNGKILLWEYHLTRIKKTMKVLGINECSDFIINLIPEKILELYTYLNITTCARVRMHVFRQSGGLYTPQNNHAQSLISMSETDSPSLKIIDQVGFAQSIYLYYSTISALKTNNCLPYILAGKEKVENNLDDIILLDQDQNIAEAMSANIFWIKDDQLFTSPLSTGCVEGVRRAYICNQNHVIEQKIDQKTILLADSVFSTNVAGINIYTKINQKLFNYHNKIKFYESLI